MSGERQAILNQQRTWAGARRIQTSANGRALKLEDNLFQPLSAKTKMEYDTGSGGELGGGSSEKPPKLHALHSSAALACNVFDYWRGKELKELATALGIPETPARLRFEGKLATGVRGGPCNLDVVLETRDGGLIGIESKFTEPYGAKSTPGSLGDQYVPKEKTTPSPWTARELHACDRLARDVAGGVRPFKYLDAAQLLKHVLGLHRATGRRPQLLYLWFDMPGEAGRTHRAEVEEVCKAVGGEVDLTAISYQELIGRLRVSLPVEHSAYLAYLQDRYVSNAQLPA